MERITSREAHEEITDKGVAGMCGWLSSLILDCQVAPQPQPPRRQAQTDPTGQRADDGIFE